LRLPATIRDFLAPESVSIAWRIDLRAVVLEKFWGLDSLVYKQIPDPEPNAGMSSSKHW